MCFFIISSSSLLLFIYLFLLLFYFVLVKNSIGTPRTRILRYISEVSNKSPLVPHICNLKHQSIFIHYNTINN